MATEEQRSVDSWKMHWPFYNWVIHLLLTVGMLAAFYFDWTALSDQLTPWFFVSLNVASVVIVLFAISFFKGALSRLISCVTVLCGAFIIPAGFYFVTNNFYYSVVCLLIFSIVSIAMSPMLLSGGVFLIGGAYIYLFKRLKLAEGETIGIRQIFIWLGLYICIIVVAFLWRFILEKLWQFIHRVQPRIQVVGDDAEKQQLRKSLALHILRLNEITGYKYREKLTEDEL